mgnify:CR=1 FL=1
MAARKKVDYARIEPAWRAGIKSPDQLAEEYTKITGIPVSRQAIVKYFKSKGIDRDLKAKIQAKADAMVAASMVAAKVAEERTATEPDIVEAGAIAVAGVRIAHRADIGKSRSLAMKLLSELQDQTENNDLYQQLAELLIETPDDKDNEAAQERQRKRLEVFRAAVSLPGRSKIMKEMADTLKTLIGLEREAYGLNSDLAPSGGGFFESTLDLLSRSE